MQGRNTGGIEPTTETSQLSPPQFRARARLSPVLLLLGLGLLELLWPSEGSISLLRGSHQAVAQERVPLDENFSGGEQIFIWAAGGVASGLTYFQSDLLKWTAHEPWIGAPAPWEAAISDSLYQGADYQLMNGFPDTFGEKVAPYLAIGWYTGNGFLLGIQGKSLTGSVNADHEAFAFMEAYGLDLALTQLAKISVRRLRPFWALERDVSVPTYDDSYLSFFSGHSSSSFCIAAFVTRDLTDFLVSGPLANAPLPVQVGLGRIVPGAALYGLAGLIAYSRVVDQQHFLTDVLVGSLVGATLGNVVYARHFDLSGTPRRNAVGQSARTRLYASPTQISFQFQW